MPAPAAPEARVVLVGDSTMQTRTGYGDALCGLFKWQVECANLARGGRSTKSFRADGSWDRVTAKLAEGPAGVPAFVLVQFGHNDQPGKAERTTDLATEFPANLARYIAEIRKAGATPILVTPLARRQFRPDGTLSNDLAPWAASVRDVARRERVPLVDLNADSVAALEKMGPTRADTLAEAPAPDPAFDRTHLGPRGAALFARLVAKALVTAEPATRKHMVVGAVEADGPIKRPQMDAATARAHAYAAVLGDWDPLAQPIDMGKPDYVVAATGPFRSVQSAVDHAVARIQAGERPARIRIELKPGVYEGLLAIPDVPVPFTLYSLEGDARRVKIRATLEAVAAGSTPGSSATRIRNRGFQAKNLTFENGHNRDRGDFANLSQAVALMLEDADRAHFENVRFLGYQDTLFLASTTPERPARAFFHRVYVEGDMDFIFGEAIGYFQESEIRTLGDRGVSYTLAPSTHRAAPHGFVFERCRFTHDGSPHARGGLFKLARQWYRNEDAVGKVAILHSCIGDHIDAERPWADWSIGTPRYRPVQYEFLAEYENTTGPCP